MSKEFSCQCLGRDSRHDMQALYFQQIFELDDIEFCRAFNATAAELESWKRTAQDESPGVRRWYSNLPLFNSIWLMACLLRHTFANDEDKMKLWVKSPNPILGGISPYDFVRICPGAFRRLVKIFEGIQ